MDELVARVSLEPSQAKNEEALEEDGEILYSEQTWEDCNESNDGEDDGVLPFDEKEDLELARAVEEGLITPPLSDAYAAYTIPFQVIERGEPSTTTPSLRIQDTQSKPGIQEDDWDEQWEAFQRVRIGSLTLLERNLRQLSMSTFSPMRKWDHLRRSRGLGPRVIKCWVVCGSLSTKQTNMASYRNVKPGL